MKMLKITILTVTVLALLVWIVKVLIGSNDIEQDKEDDEITLGVNI